MGCCTSQKYTKTSTKQSTPDIEFPVKSINNAPFALEIIPPTDY